MGGMPRGTHVLRGSPTREAGRTATERRCRGAPLPPSSLPLAFASAFASACACVGLNSACLGLEPDCSPTVRRFECQRCSNPLTSRSSRPSLAATSTVATSMAAASMAAASTVAQLAMARPLSTPQAAYLLTRLPWGRLAAWAAAAWAAAAYTTRLLRFSCRRSRPSRLRIPLPPKRRKRRRRQPSEQVGATHLLRHSPPPPLSSSSSLLLLCTLSSPLTAPPLHLLCSPTSPPP